MRKVETDKTFGIKIYNFIQAFRAYILQNTNQTFRIVGNI